MKKGDVFEVTVRRFYTSDEAPVITPTSTALVRVTDPSKVVDSCSRMIVDLVDHLDEASKQLPFAHVRQMTEVEVQTLRDDEDAMDSVEGMTRQ